MYSTNNVSSLYRLLNLSDQELTSNWTKLASLIRAYEFSTWDFARMKAVELLGEGAAHDYIRSVRENPENRPPDIPKTITKSEPPVPTPPVPAIPQTIPVPKQVKKKNCRHNYEQLVQLAPDLEQHLGFSNHLNRRLKSGTSSVTGYMDFTMQLMSQEGNDYYIALSQTDNQYGRQANNTAMIVLLDLDGRRLESLVFKNGFQRKQVYDDIYERKMVDPGERKTQNAFLARWLKELIKQGHRIKWQQLAIPDDEFEDEDDEDTADLEEDEDKQDEPQPEPEPQYGMHTQIIASNLNLSLDEAETKRKKMITMGKDKLHLLFSYGKRRITNIEELQGYNFTLLSEVIPDLQMRMAYPYSIGDLLLTDSNEPAFKITRARSRNQTVVPLGLHESKGKGKLLITLDFEQRRAWVSILTGNFMQQGDYWNQAPNMSSDAHYTANMRLADWLESLYVDDCLIDWKNDPKEGIIPDFEPGEVQLTPGHIRAGIEQKAIDWINEHRQGLILRPIIPQTDENTNLCTRFECALHRPGFRIDHRGKIFYSGRSQRD